MTIVHDRPATCDWEPADAEALFKEAKRRQRRRRLRNGGIVAFLVVVALVIATTIGGSGSSRVSPGDTSGSLPIRSVPEPRPWPVTAVAAGRFVSTPVALPRSSFAYAVSVVAMSPTSSRGRLARIDLATGRVVLGPTVPSNSQLFTLGGSLEVVSRTTAMSGGDSTDPWIIRPVIGQSISLGRPLLLPFSTADQGATIAVSDGPAVDDGVWLGSQDSVFLVNVSSGALMRRQNLGAPVSSISVDPAGRFLYVALEETLPKAKVPTVVEELNARTGRLMDRVGLDNTTGWANLTAAQDGVWVSYRGGMMGTAVLLRADGLATAPSRRVSPSSGQVIPAAGVGVEMGIETARVGPTVWLEGPAGVSCVSASSGAFRAGAPYPVRTETTSTPLESTEVDGHLYTSGGVIHQAFPVTWSPFDTWDGHVYASEAVSNSEMLEVVSVTVPPSCR